MDNKVIIRLGKEEATFDLKEKKFRTGSVGFYGFGRMTTVEGKRYQLSINVVEIGSKHRRT